MKRIEEFITSVYAHVKDKEANELKTEMRAHLLEAVEELKAEGQSEEEAVSIALERFGDEGMLRGKLVEHFRVPRVFSVNLLRTAIFFAVLGILLGCIFFINDYRLESQRIQVAESTFKLLDDGEISESDKEVIVERIEKSTQITNFHIYQEKGLSSRVVFEYQRAKPFKTMLYINGMGGEGHSAGDWSVDILFEYFTFVWRYAIMLCFIIYWILFAIWAMIQGYRHSKLHLMWMVAFSLFNVPAYLVYRASLKNYIST